MRDHSTESASALAQELVSTRAALQTAIRIGERLEARIAKAREVADQLPPIPSRALLLRALDGDL